MEFQRIELHQFQQAGCIFDNEVIRVGSGLFGQLDRAHALKAGRVVFLEKARLYRSARAADDRQRPAHDLR